MATGSPEQDDPSRRKDGLPPSEPPRLSVAMLVSSQGLTPAELELRDRINLDLRFDFAGVIMGDIGFSTRTRGNLQRNHRIASLLLKSVATMEGLFSNGFNSIAGERPSNSDHIAKTFTLEPLSGSQSPPLYRAVSTRRVAFEADVVVSLNHVSAGFWIEGVRHGIWSVAYSDLSSLESEPPAFWEVFLGEGVTGVTLQANTRDGGEAATIATALFPTKLTYSRNLVLVRDNAIELIWRELKRLESKGAPKLPATNPHRPRRVEPPTVSEVLRYAASAASRVLHRSARRSVAGSRILTEHWSLFVGEGPYERTSWASAIETRPPLDESWADPFLIRGESGTTDYVFFEKFTSTVRRGRISVGRIVNRQIECIGDAIVVPYHISYPHVFRYRGEIWMLPETSEMRRLELWRCISFPLEWELETIALDGSDLVDPTLCEYQGNWWLFANAASRNSTDHNSELHVFRIGSPMLEDIVPHRLNPVVIDATRARSGGRIHQIDGVLMRSAQNNAFRYGYGLGVYAIKKLTLDDYEEELVFGIEPNFRPSLVACHHLDTNGRIFVFDGQRKRVGSCLSRSRKRSPPS